MIDVDVDPDVDLERKQRIHDWLMFSLSLVSFLVLLPAAPFLQFAVKSALSCSQSNSINEPPTCCGAMLRILHNIYFD